MISSPGGSFVLCEEQKDDSQHTSGRGEMRPVVGASRLEEFVELCGVEWAGIEPVHTLPVGSGESFHKISSNATCPYGRYAMNTLRPLNSP